jgi:glycosyltransferase involved in cell wall biosynthesis
MQTPRVSVVIPTFRRPEALRRAIASVLAQRGLDRPIEVVVVDADPCGSAAAVVRSVRTASPVPVVHVEAAWDVRGAGVAASRGELVAFLDEDASAAPTWLARMAAVQDRFQADVVFGPVTACVPAGTPHRRYLQGFFSRRGPASSGIIPGYFGWGNSLARRAALTFSPAVGRSSAAGDEAIFRRLKRNGARFAWACDATMFEHPPAERLSLAYALARAFANGQGAASDRWTAGPSQWAAAPLWMGWGLAQAAAYGLASLLQWLWRSSERAFMLDRAARSLGAALWFRPFRAGA